MLAPQPAKESNRLLKTEPEGPADQYAPSLLDGEEGFRKLVDSSPDAIFIHCEGTITYVNSAMIAMIGASSAGDLVGKPHTCMLAAEHLDSSRRRAQALYAGMPQPRIERVYLRMDGKPIDVEIASAPVTLNGKAAAQVIVRDITERKRTAAALSKSEERFKSLTALASDWYWEQDENFRFTFRSGNTEKTMGLTYDEVLGKTRWELPTLNLTEADWIRHRTKLERWEPFHDFEIERPGPNGRSRWVSLSGEPVFDARGRFMGYRGVGHDITEAHEARERIEKMNAQLEERIEERTRELRAALKELDSFAYSVSHDLRAPVGAVSGFSHLLRNNEAPHLSEDGKHLLRMIERNSEHMISLIDGMLRLSQLGRGQIRRVPTSMGAIARDAASLHHGSPNAEFKLQEIPDCLGDPVLLRQVWANLISNALKYSRMRTPARIDIGWDDDKRAYFVRDNGVGFDMQYAAKLFGVFERLHADPEFEGSGIGLAIVHRIIDRHGGRIWAEAAPEQGATFWFTLPGAR
jgi:PAS domain S-box-containing protein